MGQMGHGCRVSVIAFDGSNGSWPAQSIRPMGQMGHDPLSCKPCQKGQTDAPMGQMGQWVMGIFFAPAFTGVRPAAIATTVSPIKQNHLLVKSYKPMTHLTHCPVKIGAFAMTPTQPSATHRAMGHANRLHCYKCCGKMLSMRSRERANWS